MNGSNPLNMDGHIGTREDKGPKKLYYIFVIVCIINSPIPSPSANIFFRLSAD